MQQNLPALQADQLSFGYSGEPKLALQDLTFSIAPGSCVAILGANGSGKTTLARLLAGILTPTAGTLNLLGYPAGLTESWETLRGRVGLVFQSPDQQMVATTVEREIAFGLENLGVPSPEIRARVDEMLARFRLEPYQQRSPHLLSGGEKQRVALASVLVMRPEIFILDEVTSLLDPQDRRAVLELILSLKGQCTLVFITQFSTEALIADRVIILHDGRLVEDASPEPLFSAAEGEALYDVEVPLAYRLIRKCAI